MPCVCPSKRLSRLSLKNNIMLSPKLFVDTLAAQGMDFYAGVPDSLLKYMCAYIADHLDTCHNVIAANEGAAVALAAGYHLATGKTGVVYMQNSVEGNAINPLASLVDGDAYAIPVLLLIGWRGRPGVHDEPQHGKQGKVTTGLLNVMGIDYDVLSKDSDTAVRQIAKAASVLHSGRVYALVIEKDTFEPYTLQHTEENRLTLSREQAIQMVAGAVGPRDAIVSTTGMTSRELFEYRASRGESHERDFLTVGSMGHASQIALGIALQQPDRRVWCFDGDGATIMHMGSLAIVASKHPANLVHTIFNNGAHDSVGGQPTEGLYIDIPAIACAVGYADVYSVDTEQTLADTLAKIKDLKPEGPVLLEVKVRKGNRKDLGRPTTTPIENKQALIHFLSE